MAATSPDILESLPPAMQDEILSRLPVRDAARTSVLSRAWRRRWEPLAYRFLHWPLGVAADTVDFFLARCAYPVREFRHPRVPEPDFVRSDLWLLRLAAVGVRSISVEFERWPPIHMLHSCIFSCRDLATLELVGCDIPAPPPSFVGLPSLSSLSLFRVGFPQGVRGLEALISLSPSLRKLQLEELIIPMVEVGDGAVVEQWVINAPNLQQLRIISSYDDGWHFSGLPFLEVAEMTGLEGYYAEGRDFLKFISALDQARNLKLTMPITWDDTLEGLSPSFGNLKSLSLQTEFCYAASILSIICVVRNAPRLEVLDIELTEYIHQYGVDLGFDFLYAQCADDSFANLTTFRMKDAMFEPHEMVFMEFVLSKANQLEAFDVCLSRRCSSSVEEALDYVGQFRRVSPGANVIISSMDHN